MWLSLLLALVAVVLVVRLQQPAPDPVVLVVTPADSVAAPYERGRQPGYTWRHGTSREKRRGHPILDEEETSVSSSFSLEAEKKASALLIEVNSADTLTLQLLRGIGPTIARRIVRYRERLGGFYRVEQLREVYGMTDDRYQALVPHLTLVADSIRRIDINKVTIKELMRHPYVDAYLARDIIHYRDKGHTYRSADDLRLVATMDDSTLARLTPYLSFTN